jgi:hypothetical protein
MAGQEDTCWRCSADWIYADGSKRTRSRVIARSASAGRPPGNTWVAPQIQLDADRWAREGRNLGAVATAASAGVAAESKRIVVRLPSRAGTTGPPRGVLGHGQKFKQLPDILIASDRVGERQVTVDRVVVAPAVSLAADVPGSVELRDDAVRGALGDPQMATDVDQTHARIASDANQRSSMVG